MCLIALLCTVFGGYEPASRNKHKTVVIGGKLYMWAGAVRGLPLVHDSPEKRAFVSSVDVFHLESGDWVQQLTSGTPPRAGGSKFQLGGI